ncbi:MAG: T9SS type A sorting domain-containing protein [Bacteroidales bacterium]|jgi:hypothetical protein|nr:T9SS type A sorting domain-containing protein [Bacteroidales bacterium]
MKKSYAILFIFCLVFILNLVNAQPNVFKVLSSLENSLPNALSSTGEFLVGIKASAPEGGYIYEIATDQITFPDNLLEGTAVLSDKTVAGHFFYPDYPFGGTTKDVTIAGIWENGTFSYLGLGNLTANDIFCSSDGSHAHALSSDKKKVAGCLVKNEFSFVAPCVWTKNVAGNWDYQIYKVPDNTGLPNTKNGRIFSISDDGTIATGYTLNNFGDRVVTIWKSPTEYVRFEEISSTFDQGYEVSKNGKYIALCYNNKATLYIVAEDKLVHIPVHQNAKSSVATAVTDNGVVVGYSEFTAAGGGAYRWGFIYSQAFGFFDLAEFIEKFAPDVNTYPIDFTALNFTVPMCVSNNGLAIAGWWGSGVLDRTSWVLKLSKEPEILNRPMNPTIEVMNHKTVSLNWDTPASMPGHTLTGYEIYRNNISIGNVSAGVTTYYFDDLLEGTNYYTIAAKYGNELSPKTDPLTAEIYSLALPFLEDFESGAFATNFWKKEPVNSLFLIVTPEMYGSNRGISGNGVTYISGIASKSFSLVSKDFSAAGQQNVFLKFALKILFNELADSPEKLFVEAKPIDGNWQTVATYDASILNEGTKVYGWNIETIDLSPVVANKEFQIRFRFFNTVDYDANNWDIDNVRIDFHPRSDQVLAPGKPEGTLLENNAVELIWQSPTGSYDLTYLNEVPFSAIGNEGISFIAVNSFSSAQLTPYINKYLTSISVHISQYKDGNPSHKLSLVVYVDNISVLEQSITSYKSNAWNTYSLNQPILIEAGKNLKFGIKVNEHHPTEWPISLDKSYKIIEEGNLYSEDNGTTWLKLSDEGITDNLAIIGNLTNTNAATVLGRLEDFLGYLLYHNGKIVSNKINYQTNFKDINIDLSIQNKYLLSAYYNNGMESNNSSVYVLSIDLQQCNNKIQYYPNPATDKIYIQGNISKVTLFDLSGRAVLETNTNTISVTHLSKGIYLLKIESGLQTSVGKVVIM